MVVVEAIVIDSTHLELAGPIDAREGARLTVHMVEPGDVDHDYEAWLASFPGWLAEAYGEVEPDYSLDLVREANAEYRG